MLTFELLKTEGQARRGRLTLNHGVVQTPIFMPVGTQASVKGLTQRQLAEDLDALYNVAEALRQRMTRIPGLADVQVEKQVRIPQLEIRVDYGRSALYGVQPAVFRVLAAMALPSLIPIRATEAEALADHQGLPSAQRREEQLEILMQLLTLQVLLGRGMGILQQLPQIAVLTEPDTSVEGDGLGLALQGEPHHLHAQPQGLRPLRYERRVARNRFFLLFALLLAVLYGLFKAIVGSR